MMLKLFKITVYALLGLLLLTIISVIILTKITDPNDFKGPIQNELTHLTGLNTEIAGEIGWNLFPTLGLTVNQVSLENPPGFQSKNFAQINQIDFKLKLLPLIRRKIEISQIKLDQLSVNLEVNAQGRQNWDSLVPEPDISTSQTSTDTASDTSNWAMLGALNIAEISVTQGSISYLNQADNQKFSIDAINFSSKELQLDRTFPISLNFKVKGEQANNQIAAGDISLRGQVRVDGEMLTSNDEVLQAVTFKGRLQAEPIVLASLSIDSLNTDIDLQDSVLDLSPIQIALYQGHASGDLSIDLTKQVPTFALTQTIEGIQTGPLLNDVIGTARITGTSAMALELNAQGDSTDQILNSLGGNISFEVKDGTLEGIDIPYLVQWASAIFQGQNQPTEASTNQTDFGSLTGTATIQNGVISNQDLQLQSPHYLITGSGIIDLTTQDLTFRLQTEILNLSDSNVIQQAQKALGGSIPIVIGGTFTNLVVQPDINRIISNRATSFIQEQADKLLNSDDGSGDDIGTRAKQLFDQFIPSSQ